MELIPAPERVGPDRDVPRRGRSDAAVVPGREAGELAELPAEVRLVAVARAQGQVGPLCGRVPRHAVERTLEAQDAAVELRRQPDGAAEEGDEAAVAVPARRHDLAYPRVRRESL